MEVPELSHCWCVAVSSSFINSFSLPRKVKAAGPLLSLGAFASVLLNAM